MNLTCTYTERNDKATTIAKEILMQKDGTFLLYGKKGIGKKSFVKKTFNYLNNKILIYRLVDNSLCSLKGNERNFSISFSLNYILGISISGKDDSSILNYIINKFNKKISFKDYLIYIPDYEYTSPEERKFLNILFNHKSFIEKKIGKKITVLTTVNERFIFEIIKSQFRNHVNFSDLKKENIKKYLIENFDIVDGVLTKENLSTIFNLCGSNLNLVNLYYEHIINKNFCSLSEDFDKILEEKISGIDFIDSCKKDNLKYLLDISSLTLGSFSLDIVEYVIKENIQLKQNIKKYFDYSVEQYLFEIEHNKYEFLSNEIKSYLFNKVKGQYKSIIQSYYEYLTKYLEDNYTERVLYLYQCTQELNSEIWGLIILALSKNFLLNDLIELKKIDDIFSDMNKHKDDERLFNNIKSAFRYHYNQDYMSCIKILEKVNVDDLNLIGNAELTRLKFKSGLLGKVDGILSKEDVFNLANKLEGFIINKEIQINVPLHSKEYAFRFRILQDILPYILDSLNDRNRFSLLHNEFINISRYINGTFIKRDFYEYMHHVFNRKAFLFEPPNIALMYYNEAKHYFEKNDFYYELVMTLAGRAGMYIFTKEYSKAISDCNYSIDYIKKYNLNIPQPEKIYNNLYISEFLKCETDCINKIDNILRCAQMTISKLRRLLSNEANAKNHVILTNIASLSLYIGNIESYIETKEIIEKSLNCKDVSDIKDDTINDFYRYHFAWYEFYKNIIHSNWEQCQRILNDLNGFHPALFNNKLEIIARTKAAQLLLDEQKVPTNIEFCINFTKSISSVKEKFNSRGLLLSDLQFTSYN